MSFLQIKVSNDISRLFKSIKVPGDKTPGDEYHITLICFEDDFSMEDATEALLPIFKSINNFEPFKVKTNTITNFPAGKDNYPIIAKIESTELHDLQKELRKALDKADVEYKNNYPEYKPHVTLSYSEEDIKDYKIDPIEFMVHEIVFSVGEEAHDQVSIIFPLKNTSSQKAAFLQLKSELFYKFASKD